MKKPIVIASAAALAAASLLVVASLDHEEGARSHGFERVELAPIEHHSATLTVHGETETVRYSNAELERFDAYALTTKTPWRDAPAVFEGVLLTDVLAEHGLDDEPTLRIVAENDYVVEVPREVWTSRPALIATRVDGVGLSRRDRGPFYLVFPLDADPSTGGEFATYWVWMMADISAP